MHQQGRAVGAGKGNVEDVWSARGGGPGKRCRGSAPRPRGDAAARSPAGASGLILGARLKRLGLEHFLGAHCTGIEAVYRIRQQCGLSRATAVVGSVGATFTLGSGIAATSLAR